MFKNKLAAVIMAVFTAITFSVAAQTAEAKPVRPAPDKYWFRRRYVKLQNCRRSVNVLILMRMFCRRSLTEAGVLKSCATLLCCQLASGKNINEILRLKENNSWPRVEYLTGITPNDIKAARDRNDARYFAAVLGLKEKRTSFLTCVRITR